MREATPEAQMQKLILETIEELPNTARVRSALSMAHNMIGQLETELRTLREDKERLDSGDIHVGGWLYLKRNLRADIDRAKDKQRRVSDGDDG